VCRPVPIDGSLLNTITDEAGRPALLLCSTFAHGVALDDSRESDAELTGTTLAGLHRSLARVTTHDLPEVATLRTLPPADGDDEIQLLHGDFNAGNLRRSGESVQVFDFEDCGLGPRSFDVANALYMVLFDSTVNQAPARYRTFEDAFLRGYAKEAGRHVSRETILRYIDRRVDALACWLDDLSTAPIGIRTASPRWHRTLRSFVSGYKQR
jgi:Ser/Thr protein kinase RdoA (MazF antagonist)